VPATEAARFRDAGGVPTDFNAIDAIVSAAAQRRLAVVPVVQATPRWAARRRNDPASPPADNATFGRFLGALVARYGPQGAFWAEHPDLPRVPIRAWQVWNEPNITRYWSQQPFASSYVRLLKTAEHALHAADHGATVVLAGLPNVSWTALRAIYDAGGRGHFDAVALHPYTRRPADVLRLVHLARRELRRHHDSRVPVWLTELSWPAARGKLPRPSSFETTDRGQAQRLGAVMTLIAAARKRERIARVFWYTWLSDEHGPNAFAWSGLRRLRAAGPVSSPALAVFRRWAIRLEGCRKVPGDARRCT
jgi:hypothetical protein